MNVDKTNQLLTLGANIGILVGIIFLAFELNQNNELMEADARFNRFNVSTVVPMSYLEYSDIDLLEIAGKTQDEMSPKERTAFSILWNTAFLGHEWTFNELPQTELPIERWRRTAAVPFIRNLWDERKQELDQQFVRFMDENVYNQ